MFDWLSGCGFWSDIPKAGDFALETYNKVPAIGGIFGNLSSITQNNDSFNNILGASQNQRQRSNNSQISPSRFVNNIPSQSLSATNQHF